MGRGLRGPLPVPHSTWITHSGVEEQDLVNTALAIEINSDVIKRNDDKNFPPKMKPNCF